MDSVKHEMAEAVHQLLHDRLSELIDAEGLFEDFDDVRLEVTRIDDLNSMVRLAITRDERHLAPRYFVVKVSEQL